MSQYSARSGGQRPNYAGRYRKVAHGSNVDETLFGERNASARIASARNGGGRQNSARGSQQLQNTGRNLASGRVVSGGGQSVVISSYDLMRMKASTVIQTPEDLQREKAAAQQAQEQRQRASKARKARMLKLEAERKKNAPLSVLEKEDLAAKKKILKRAEYLRDEARDDVKTMNAFQKYARTVTIRDQQKRDKIERERRAKEQDLVKDMEMEIDRLQTIKMYKDREAELKHKLVEDRKVIEQQIARRAKQREVHKEAIRAEQAERKLQMQRQAEQEKEELAIEQERQRVHLAEVLKANSAAIAAKEKLKQDEIEEDKRIMAYLKAEDEKKKAREEEEERQKAARELEIARLRAQQEKSQDKQAELDALRAKRAFEHGEREFRKKQLELARKRAAQQEELLASRRKQKEDKEWELALEAKRQREEFLRNQKVQAEWLAREREEAEAKRAAALRHKDELLVEIETRESESKVKRREYLAQAEVEKEVREAELERLRRIRDKKVRELLDQGVDSKYTVQLAGYRPEDLLSKDYKLGGRIPTIN